MTPAAFTVKTLAERWMFSPKTIYGMIKAGVLHPLPGVAHHRISAIEVQRVESCGLNYTEDGGQSSGATAAKPSAALQERLTARRLNASSQTCDPAPFPTLEALSQ